MSDEPARVLRVIWCPATVARRQTAPPDPIVVQPEFASPLTKLARLKNELIAWNKAGRPIATKAVRRERLAFCKACKFYQPGGNFGFGECHAPGCGCSRAKLWLATSKCPLTPPKWGQS